MGAAPWVDQPTGLSVNASALVSTGAFSVTEWSTTTFGANQEAYITMTTPAPTATPPPFDARGSFSLAGAEVWSSDVGVSFIPLVMLLALGVLFDLLDRLAGVLGDQLGGGARQLVAG